MVAVRAASRQPPATSMNKIRILIADDHEVIRKGLALVLRQEPDFEIVGEAEDGVEAAAEARRLEPDLILLDWKMPRMDGLAAAVAIRQQTPAARILVLSGAPVEDAVLDNLENGVDGFVHKGISPDNLALAIRVVAGGQPYLSPEVTKALLTRAQSGASRDPRAPLSPRELDVLRLMATPATYRQIGERLSVSEETVRSHVKNIFAKLKQPNRTQAVIAGLRLGLISLD